MISHSPMGKFHFITNGNTTNHVVAQVKRFCLGGGKWVQLRMKNASLQTVYSTAVEVKNICKNYDAKLIINDFVEIAHSVNADGVHLGQDDCSPEDARICLGKDALIGYTINSFSELNYSALKNCNYLGVGPFRYTSTKRNLKPVLGIEGYCNLIESTIYKEISRPIIAVGGIQLPDVPSLMQVGVYGCAVSSAITDTTNPIFTTKQFIEIFKKEYHVTK